MPPLRRLPQTTGERVDMDNVPRLARNFEKIKNLPKRRPGE
jgi:hypothetical protein